MDKREYWFLYTSLYLMVCSNFSTGSKVVEDYIDSKDKSPHVEVRAVFIECAEREELPDSEIARFQRQERFKHNALHDCNKKLALTLKMASEPNFRLLEDDKSQQTPGEEYIPIDHVLEGPERKRVRLLHPYILRLRRDAPLQAYKLNKIDTVKGILTNDRPKHSFDKDNGKQNLIRTQRDTEHTLDDWSPAAIFRLEHEEPGRHSFSIRLSDFERSNDNTAYEKQSISKDCGLRLFALSPPPQNDLNVTANTLRSFVEDSDAYAICTSDDRMLIREKRNDHNVDINDIERNNNHNNKDQNDDRTEPTGKSFEMSNEEPIGNKDKRSNVRHHKTRTSKVNFRQEKRPTEKETKISENDKDNERNTRRLNSEFNEEFYSDESERTFGLYEIGDPNVWYNVQIQLFEKLSAPDGKTVWNDMTNGALASVSTMNPEWKGEDVHLRYRPAEFIGRDDFTLPQTSLCLLEPLVDPDSNFTVDSDNMRYDFGDKYIVVPIEDVIGLDQPISLFKQNDNDTDSTTNSDEKIERHRKVQVRVSRALIGNNIDNFNIANHGSERFLTLPHRRSHRAQIDVEVRADDNQLVRVGSLGRLSTIVSDHTRKTRAVLTVQATNTGLASAGFRAMVRDCGPELTELVNEKSSEGSTAGPILLPPQHTKSLRIELPIEFPVETAHCSVALVNDDDEAVAIRDVAVKKGDRCFCVFHCDCVCLSDDSKLLCREMSETRQAAAGLSTQGHSRHTRSTQYLDSMSLDAWGSAFGVIIFLLALGFCKAILGLFSARIGNWGLGLLVASPRSMDQYFEEDLKGQQVVYDDKGKPVHPQTHKPVRMFSRNSQFVLNLVFFVVTPGLLICTCLKKFLIMITPKAFNTSYKNISEKCFSSHDIQNVKLFIRRRRYDLQKWMTPPAEELTQSIWKKGLSVGDDSTKSEIHDHDPSPDSKTLSKACPCVVSKQKQCPHLMQPLLHEPALTNHTKLKRDVLTVSHTTADADSEQDDTEYVLTQMQKSRESLARSLRRQNDSGPSTDRNHQGRGDAAAISKR